MIILSKIVTTNFLDMVFIVTLGRIVVVGSIVTVGVMPGGVFLLDYIIYCCYLYDVIMLPPPLGHALGFIEDVITQVGIFLPPPILREIGTLAKVGHWLLLL